MQLRYIIIFAVCLSYFFGSSLLGQTHVNLSQEDSILVLKRIYMYDFVDSTFDHIDEPYLETLWQEKNDYAKSLFHKAIMLSTAPVGQRMIIASYFYKDNDYTKVEYLLSQCQNRHDSIRAIKIMRSYNIKYSDFDLEENTVRRYCNHCEYK